MKLGLLVVCALSLSALVWWWTRTEDLVAALPIGGRLELAAGDVRVTRGKDTGPTVSGMPLSDQAQVTTGKGARALVRLVGGASAFLGDATTIALAGNGLSLDQGRVWIDVPRVAQPIVHAVGKASVAVSDAGLSIERNKDDVEIYVAHGLAVVTAENARREVAAGERAKVSASGNIAVEPVTFFEDWTGGMADRGLSVGFGATGAGRLYAVDRQASAGSAVQPLSIKQQVVRAKIADGVAETSVDQTFFNASDRVVEGYYWFTVPERALVTGFALETHGVLVEGEVVERNEAAAKYEAAVQTAQDPALLEWVNDRTYRARIYPIANLGTRRVVLRYIEPIALGDGRMRWVYPMGQAEPNAPTIDELSLTLELGALGQNAEIATLPDARVEDGGRRVTMRRSVYTPRGDFQVELIPKQAVKPLRVTRFDAGGDQADFVMLRWVPDVDWSAGTASAAHLVLAVDMSAGGQDADRQLKIAVAEAILRNLAAGDQFAVMTTDVTPRVIYPDSGLATADAKNVSAALERLSSRAAGGATDLGAIFDAGLVRLHASEQPALVYIGDGLATSGELRGEEVVERMRRSLVGARARFFTIGVGTEVNHPLLERLASVGGGTHYRVDNDELAVRESLRLTADVKTPTITDLAIDLGVGLDEPLFNASGKLARGQELTLLARTHHALPDQATISGRLFGKSFKQSHKVELERGSATALVPRLWAAELARRAMGRAATPDAARGKIVALAIEYGLVTPFSSILALDSEGAYQNMGIQRRHRPWDHLAVEVTSLSPAQTTLSEDALALAFAPLTLLTGCDNGSPSNVFRQEAPVPVSATAPVTPPAPPSPTTPASAPTADQAPLEAEMAEPTPAPSVAMAAEKSAGGAVMGELAAYDAPKLRTRSSASQRRQRLGTEYDDSRDEDGTAERSARISAYALPSVCSDLSARPLIDRIPLWQRRLRSSHSMAEALALYDASRAACEVSGQRDQRALLSLVEPFATNAEAAEMLLGHFQHDDAAVGFLARRIVRRTLDPHVAAVARARVRGGAVDWNRLDLELAALSTDDARIARLRTLLLAMPGDVDAEMRVMKLLVRNGKRDEALAMASRLRDRGPLSPWLLRDLGDVQLEAGLRDDALRTYTEIVEFDPQSADARRLVGDTLLAHGWYDVAYRQFRTLVELSPGDSTSEVRLARAAAGAGRVDEALRILRHVAESDAEPGPNDPRMPARMLAGALLGRLLADGTNDAARTEALTRQLKQLQLWSGTGKLYVLTWEALDVALGFGVATGDVTDAAPLGLMALVSPELSLEAVTQSINRRSERTGRGKVHYTLHELTFDGSRFVVSVVPGDLS